MFHGRISLNSILLYLRLILLNRFRFELIYISFIINVRSSIIHFHNRWYKSYITSLKVVIVGKSLISAELDFDRNLYFVFYDKILQIYGRHWVCKFYRQILSKYQQISNKKIHWLCIKGYFIIKNTFVVQVTFNSSKASGSDCISELFYLLAELFKMYMKESFFLHFWKVSSWVPEEFWGDING